MSVEDGQRQEAVLEVENVSKSFRGKPAVRNVTFTAQRGEITGFLGPNGAGKTTTLRMSLGIIAPDQGRTRLFGGPPNAKALERVGFLPEERGVYRKMRAEDVIAFFARLKGMPPKAARARAADYLEKFGLSDARRKKIKELSKGMAQKVQIISALVHEPEFIILDEPFSGLDPVNQALLEGMIREQADRGATILFSTHVMEHAERLCDRIVLMARGSKVFDGRVDEALGVVPRQITVETADGDDVETVAGAFGSVERLETAAGGGAVWRVILNPGADAQAVLRALVEAGVKLTRFEPLRPHLHDAFVRLVADPADAVSEPEPVR